MAEMSPETGGWPGYFMRRLEESHALKRADSNAERDAQLEYLGPGLSGEDHVNLIHDAYAQPGHFATLKAPPPVTTQVGAFAVPAGSQNIQLAPRPLDKTDTRGILPSQRDAYLKENPDTPATPGYSFTMPTSAKQITEGTPQTVSGLAPRTPTTRDEAFNQLAERYVPPEQRSAEFARKQLGLDAEAYRDAFLGATKAEVAAYATGEKLHNSPVKIYVKENGDRQAFQVDNVPEGQGWQIAPTGGSSRPVPYFAGAQSLTMARKMASDLGTEYLDQRGEDWDLNILPPEAVLVPVYEPGGKQYWSVATDKGRFVTWDNKRNFVNAVGHTPTNDQTLGVARVGNNRTVASPGGEQVLAGTTTPNTPGAHSTLGGTVAPRIPGSGAGGTGAGAQHKGGAPRAASSPSTTQGDIMPNIKRMTPINARIAIRSQPAVTALMGLFGDPTHPETKSMADFASLADNPHAQRVIGKAFQLMDQQMGNMHDPGVIATLGRLSGWAGIQAEVAANTQREAGNAMTPEEQEYFDTAIASMADIIGSRAATGQSAAQFSVNSMQNELPLIGSSSVTNRASYMTKMGTIARQIKVGLNAMPDNVGALAWLEKRLRELSGEHQSPAPRNEAGKGKGKGKAIHYKIVNGELVPQ